MIWLLNKALYIWRSGAIEIWFSQSTLGDSLHSVQFKI